MYEPEKAGRADVNVVVRSEEVMLSWSGAEAKVGLAIGSTGLRADVIAW